MCSPRTGQSEPMEMITLRVLSQARLITLHFPLLTCYRWGKLVHVALHTHISYHMRTITGTFIFQVVSLHSLIFPVGLEQDLCIPSPFLWFWLASLLTLYLYNWSTSSSLIACDYMDSVLSSYNWNQTIPLKSCYQLITLKSVNHYKLTNYNDRLSPNLVFNMHKYTNILLWHLVFPEFKLRAY